MNQLRKAAVVVALVLVSLAAGAATHTLPLVLPASSQSLQGFVRVLNQSDRAGTVSILAIDDSGREFGPVSLAIAARSARHFNSTDLERGNRGKGLSGGVGDGSGNWRLRLDTTLDIQPLAYIRTTDGFVTSMHDVAKEVTGTSISGATGDTWLYRVPFFNPGKNRSQVSMLRLVNPQGVGATVVIDGTDDRGDSPASRVRLSVPAGGARTVTVQDLEEGASGLTGRFGFGAGSGKWQLSVIANRPILVMNLLRSPSGHLANLSTVAAAPATVDDGMFEFAAVAAGEHHSCGVLESGTVQCWGSDRDGRSTPPGGEFVAISAGGNHNCGIRESGTVACWGDDEVGQSTPPAGVFVAVSAGYQHTCGIHESGTVECWGTDWTGQSTPPAGKFIAISAGGNHNCGILESGIVQCWGGDDGPSTPPAGRFTAVAAGSFHACGILESGTVQCWGDNFRGKSTPPDGKFAAVAAGVHHSCGILESGTVQCWGDNFRGKSTPPDGEFIAISAGSEHTCGIRESGTVECWGRNNYGQSTPADIISTTHTLPLVLPASSQALEGFVRVLNQSSRAGTVSMRAFDDTGREFGPVSLSIGARSARHFNSTDLEQGNADKGLSGGVGDGNGSWRLVLDTTLDVQPLAYVRTADGFVTSMHDVVAVDDASRYFVPFFNPGKNRSKVSMLRIINPQDAEAEVVIGGTDDRGGRSAGTLTLSVPGFGARQVSALDLEARGLGAGSGKWQLSINADRPILVMNLLRSPSGHLANLSTVAVLGDVDECQYGYTDAADFRRCLKVPGISDIPLDEIRRSNKQMQSVYAFFELGVRHALSVGEIADLSYITSSQKYFAPEYGCASCARVWRKTDLSIETTAGDTPFTLLIDEGVRAADSSDWTWLNREVRKLGSVKINNRSLSASLLDPTSRSNDYLTVNSAGNDGSNANWFDFIGDRREPSWRESIKQGIEEDSLLLVGGWDKDAVGGYLRHETSSSCRGLDEGCLWARMEFAFGFVPSNWRRLGTSFAAPNLSSALATVLAAFPETSHRNLSRLAKACARRTGHGIERLLRRSGGTGVADFTCMAEILAARNGLPADGDATATITVNDGHSVTVGRSSLVVTRQGATWRR